VMKVISIFFAVILSAFATVISQIAALVLILSGAVICSRIYIRARSLPASEAIILKSSTVNRVGQALIIAPLITAIVVMAAMSGAFTK
jgi:hypothetical protein